MSLEGILNHFGLGAADATTLDQGKRRAGACAALRAHNTRTCGGFRALPLTSALPPPAVPAVTWLSFLVFCLFVGATAGPDWVKGGVEFPDAAGTTSNVVRGAAA